MTTLITWLDHPAKRRQLITLGSGALIAAGMLTGGLLHLTTVRAGMFVVAALLAGSDIALRAYHSLRNRHISIELLVTIATAGALVIGEYWEAAAVTFLFMFGAYLEARTLNHTRQALQGLLDLAPSIATVLRGGDQVEVSPGEVVPGEIVLVKPGSKVPVDGAVIGGRAAVDESAITGESIPVEKTEGASVYAGTVNQDGLLHVRATGVGADTTLARIIRRVEEAQEEKAPTQKFIERFARWYTPAIIGLSVVVGLITRDTELALTLLVIGCPGALVISTPVSVVAGIGRAAQRGILIKGGEYLENAGKITAVAFDKTGTLTEGRPRLAEVVALQRQVLQPAPAMARQGILSGASVRGGAKAAGTSSGARALQPGRAVDGSIEGCSLGQQPAECASLGRHRRIRLRAPARAPDPGSSPGSRRRAPPRCIRDAHGPRGSRHL
jgi:Zn2+/Cd2+-exporting ATPase